MRIRTTLPVFAMFLLLGGCGETGPTSHVVQPTPQAIAMRHMLADVDQIRAFLYGTSNQDAAAIAANDLVSWAKQMPALFPPTLASQQYVDMSPERVRAANMTMNTNAALLLATVQTGNRVTISEQLAETERSGCGACHLGGIR